MTPVGQTICYAAQHRLFPMIREEKPTRGAIDKFILSRPYPGAWRLIRLIDTGAGGIVEREMQQGSHLS